MYIINRKYDKFIRKTENTKQHNTFLFWHLCSQIACKAMFTFLDMFPFVILANANILYVFVYT